ncbi:MAG: GGDEF domain-containing protein [Dehalococcoidia bacterium]
MPEVSQRDGARHGSAAVDTQSLEGRSRAKLAYQNYYRWQRFRRLALVAFLCMAGFLLLWIIPWVPSGLDASDYTPELAFTINLLGGVTITGLLALAFEELVRRQRDSLLVWASVYEEATGLHNRTYLYDRLALQCERAKSGGAPFTTIVLRLRAVGGEGGAPALSTAALESIADVIDGVMHATDVVALLSGSELAVIAQGVDETKRGRLVERLETAVWQALPRIGAWSGSDVRGGSATFGVDGTDAGSLVQAARSAAMLAAPHAQRAA